MARHTQCLEEAIWSVRYRNRYKSTIFCNKKYIQKYIHKYIQKFFQKYTECIF